MSKPIVVEFNGKIACIKEHCKDLKINPTLVYTRHSKTGESYLKCLEYYQENGVKEYRNLIGDYKVKNRILYNRWHSVKQRCENPNHNAYKDYGGRGIKVCERWQNYENFESDMLETFLEHVEQYGIKDTQLERVNNDGDYEPLNCCWATCKEQAKNRREKISKYYLPCKKSLLQHCKQNKYAYDTVVGYIIRYNLQPDEALAKYLKRGGGVKYFLPCNKLLRQHCITNNYSYDTVTYYIRQYSLQPHQALARYLKNRRKK